MTSPWEPPTAACISKTDFSISTHTVYNGSQDKNKSSKK